MPDEITEAIHIRVPPEIADAVREYSRREYGEENVSMAGRAILRRWYQRQDGENDSD